MRSKLGRAANEAIPAGCCLSGLSSSGVGDVGVNAGTRRLSALSDRFSGSVNIATTFRP